MNCCHHRVFTDHVALRRVDRGVDGVGAAVRQVLAHPLLHMGQQLLPRGEGSEVKHDAFNRNGNKKPLESGSVEGCGWTHRFVDLEDVRRRVEVGVELVDDDVEAANLLLHGHRHLGGKTMFQTAG